MRRPVVTYALALAAFLGTSCASHAQEVSSDPVQFVPRMDAALGYQFIHANAPPGGSQMFNLNGGFASASVKYKFWLSFAGEVTGTRASNISTLGQNLTLTTYTAGPRITFRRRRTIPFAQALFGAAHAGDSYFPTSTGYKTSATSFALTAGGGLDVELGHRFAVRAIEAQYLHTDFNNGVNTSQNQLMLGAGVVFKLHSRYAMPHAHAAPPPAPEAALPLPPSATEANYSMPLTAPPAETEATPAPTAGQSSAAPATPDVSDFHKHVPDAYFDYDKADLRPDTLEAIQAAAMYMQAHPDLHILVAGYSDERGTSDYNLSLGDRRANAVRDALLQAGVESNRLSSVSYGKGVQVCTTPAEPCYQRNRRAAFMPQP